MIIAAPTLVGGLNWPSRPLRARRGRYQARHEHASTRRFRAVAAAQPPPFYFCTPTYIPKCERILLPLHMLCIF